MYRRTAQIDRLGDLCCSHAYPPFLFHNRMQWVQRSDIYVSLEAYFPPPPPLYYIASLSLSLSWQRLIWQCSSARKELARPVC